MNPPLIERPDRVGRLRHTVWGALTMMAWVMYAVLWVPLVTLVAWLIGIRTAFFRLYLEENAVDPFLLAALPIIALICAVLLIGWAEYNRALFAHADQRRRRRDVTIQAVARRLGADSAVSEALRSHRVVRVRMNDDAVPVGVTVVQGGRTA